MIQQLVRNLALRSVARRRRRNAAAIDVDTVVAVADEVDDPTFRLRLMRHDHRASLGRMHGYRQGPGQPLDHRLGQVE